MADVLDCRKTRVDGLWWQASCARVAQSTQVTFGPTRDTDASDDHGQMVEAEASRRVFQAVIDSFPDEGVILEVNIRRGWGSVVQVDVITGRERESGVGVDVVRRSQLRSSIERALMGHRHEVRVLEL